MDDVDEKGNHSKGDSENPQRITMKDKEVIILLYISTYFYYINAFLLIIILERQG